VVGNPDCIGIWERYIKLLPGINNFPGKEGNLAQFAAIYKYAGH